MWLRMNEIRAFRWKTRTIRLPLFFRRNSRVISGPAISPPRLLSFDYKFRYEISYSLRDPFIRHSNDVFLRSRVVPARKHVNTYGVPRALHTGHFVWRRAPAVPHLTRTSRCWCSFFPRSPFAAVFASPSENTRFYDVQLYERLSEIFQPPPHKARRFAFFLPPRNLLEATQSWRDNRSSQVFTPPRNDVGRHPAIQCRL